MEQEQQKAEKELIMITPGYKKARTNGPFHI